jgi:hypothetical protein
MNAAEVTHGNAKRKLLEPAASPLPFARRTCAIQMCVRGYYSRRDYAEDFHAVV